MTDKSEQPGASLPLHVQRLGLSRNPFPQTPDAESFYRGDRVEGWYGELLHSVLAGKGFVLLTGEVGTGKTTLLRRLLGDLHVRQARVAWVFNAFLQGAELLAAILRDFGLEPTGSMATDVDRLNAFLLEQHKAGHPCVLVLDDAQQLDTGSLELIRMLSNLETRQHKLLQIVLSGQTELEGMLADHRLRQLASRIALHVRPQALARDEVDDYVRFRLAHAGAGNRIRLGRGAAATLHRLTGGNPRRVHQLMDRALYGVLAREREVIDSRLLEEAATELRLTLGARPRSLGLAQVAASILVLVAAVATWVVIDSRSGHWPGDALAAWSLPWSDSAPSDPTTTTQDMEDAPAPADVRTGQASPKQPENDRRAPAMESVAGYDARVPGLLGLLSTQPKISEQAQPEVLACFDNLGVPPAKARILARITPETALTQAAWLAEAGWQLLPVPEGVQETLSGLDGSPLCHWTVAGRDYVLAAGTFPESAEWEARVRWVQARLAQAGYYQDRIDGAFGPNTEQALRRFFQSRGLPERLRLDTWTTFLVLVGTTTRQDAVETASVEESGRTAGLNP